MRLRHLAPGLFAGHGAGCGLGLAVALGPPRVQVGVHGPLATSRLRHGRASVGSAAARGFGYVEEDGTPIVDREVRRADRRAGDPARLEGGLDLPSPARPHPGHRESTPRGRKQYLYHPDWRESIATARSSTRWRASPRRCRRCASATEADLALRGLVRDRVLACSVRLLDLGFFRIGSDRYTAENETFGLSTLRRKHVKVSRGVASFDYTAKGSKRHRQEIADPVVVPTIKSLLDRKGGGYELLAYRDGRSWVDVKARRHQRVPEGGDAAATTRAKDFRTWNATVLAAVELAANGHEAKTEDGPKARRHRGDQARRRLPRRTPRGLPQRLHRPPRVRPLRLRARRSAPRSSAWSPAGDPGEFVEREKIERAVLRLLRD